MTVPDRDARHFEGYAIYEGAKSHGSIALLCLIPN
jgi:hypothetical protein